MDVKREVLEAEKRIRQHLRETPVEFSPYLSQAGSCQVYLKLENLQLTGSFKLRGALSKFLSLSEAEKRRGIVTASSGNHGIAVGYVLKQFNCKGTIYLPKTATQAKIEALRLYGADLRFIGTDCVMAEARARQTAENRQQVFVSPYNDPQVIGGQGTIGIELERQLGSLDTVLVPVGGGGLIAGVAGYMKSIDNKIEILGCQPENSAVMYESVKAGRIVEIESQSTWSDGTAGGIEPGAVTLGLCQNLVDDYVLVTEDEIKMAIRLCVEKHHILVEGAAALPVASYLKVRQRFRNKTVVLVISGARIGVNALKEVLGS